MLEIQMFKKDDSQKNSNISLHSLAKKWSSFFIFLLLVYILWHW